MHKTLLQTTAATTETISRWREKDEVIVVNIDCREIAKVVRRYLDDGTGGFS